MPLLSSSSSIISILIIIATLITTLLISSSSSPSLVSAQGSRSPPNDDAKDRPDPLEGVDLSSKDLPVGANFGSRGAGALRIDAIPANTALTIQIQPHVDECFYEDVPAAGIRVFFHFEVTGGGQLDIDAYVHGADGNLIWSAEKVHEERILFKAPLGGAYRFCLSNKMSTVTVKSVAFSIQVSDKSGSQGSWNGQGKGGRKPGSAATSQDPVERMAMQIAEGMTELRNEQNYLNVRERIHRDTVESTNTRIMIYSVAEISLIMVVGFAQLWYLKSCFDRRSIV
jgi:p24 family protein beta-1